MGSVKGTIDPLEMKELTQQDLTAYTLGMGHGHLVRHGTDGTPRYVYDKNAVEESVDIILGKNN